jgi:hypothetical protein
MNRLFLLVVLLLTFSRAAATIEVSLPVITGKHGDTLDIPVLTTAIPDSGVLACQFTVGFSSGVITVLDIVTEGTMVAQPRWSAAANIEGDSLTVGAYGSGFLTGSGTLGKVRCLIKGVAGATTGLILRQFTYNAGSPVVTLKSGGISVVTGMRREGSVLPAVASLSQNFPNPFNPSTVIPYARGGGAHVRLSVISLLGQEMRVLVDGYQDAGEYRTTFDAAGMASGMYFYRLRVRPSYSVLGRDSRGGAGEFTETRRLMLMR